MPKNYVDYFDSVKIRGVDRFDELLNEEGYYDRKEAKSAADLILNMLNWDINKRYSAEQCLNHPFLSSKTKQETPFKGQENKRQ